MRMESVQQRVGSALAHGRTTGGGLEVLIALGFVSIHAPLADAVFRVKYANDAKSYYDALSGAKKLARALNNERNWRLRRARLEAMSKTVFDYWLSDPCPVCEGRGWESAEGAPFLTDHPCQGCLARPEGRAGKRPFPWLLAKPKITLHDHLSKERRRELRQRRVHFERHMDQHKSLLCALEESERIICERMGVTLR